MILLSLSALAHIEHGHSRHLGKTARSRACCHGDKGVISPAGRNGVKLVLPSLKALLHIPLYILPGHLFGLVRCKTQIQIFFNVLFIRLFRIGRQDLLHARNRKTSVLLAGRT